MNKKILLTRIISLIAILGLLVSCAPAPAAEVPVDAAPIVYHTVMTGTALDTVTVTQGTTGQYQIAFTLKSRCTPRN